MTVTTIKTGNLTANVSGTQGAAGASAYQVAVANGFVGSQAAWLLSLKGDPGITVSSTPPATPAVNQLWLQI
jgi:hypothetical protein